MRDLSTRNDELLFKRQAATLSVQDVIEVLEAVLIEVLRNGDCVGCGLDCGLQRLVAVVLLRVGGVGIAHIGVGIFDGELVVEERLLGLGFFSFDGGINRACLEDGPGDGRPKRRHDATIFEEVIAVCGLDADGARDIKFWEPLGTCDADARDLRGKFTFVGFHVWPRTNHVERELGDTLRREEPIPRHFWGVQDFVESARRIAREDGERIFEGFLFCEEAWDAGARLFHDVGALVDSEFIADARIEARLQNVVRFALEDEVRARDGESFLGRTQVDVLRTDLGREGNPGVGDGPTRRFCRGDGRFRCAAAATKDVDFPIRAKAEVGDACALRDCARIGKARVVLAQDVMGPAAVEVRLRKERGVRAEEFPIGLLQAALRDQEGDVIRDGARDEVFEDGVAEAFPPARDGVVRNDDAVIGVCGGHFVLTRFGEVCGGEARVRQVVGRDVEGGFFIVWANGREVLRAARKCRECGDN